MHTIDQYCDLAKDRAALASDRQLSRRLGFSTNSVTQWRTKRTWPSDDTMRRLADLAGMDQEQALIDLNIWRSEGPTRAMYEHIATVLAAAALRDMADRLRRDAEKYEAMAALAEEREAVAARVKQWRARRAGLADILAAALVSHEDESRALDQAARQTGLEPEQLRALLPQARKMADAIGRARRNREIVRRAGAGWTNADLADRYGLTDGHITRIVRAAVTGK